MIELSVEIEERFVRIGKQIETEEQRGVLEVLKANVDMFA